MRAIIPAYRAPEKLERCVRALREQSVQPLVIDNSQINRGFSAAVNDGLSASLNSGEEFAVVINQDCYVLPDCTSALTKFMGEHPRCAIAGCKQLLESNPDEIVHGGCTEAFPIGLHIGGRVSRGDCVLSAPMPWVNGALWIVRLSSLREIGMLDETMFLIGSDSDLCYRARQSGFEVWYCAEAEALHEGGASMRAATAELDAIMSRDRETWRRKWVATGEYARLRELMPQERLAPRPEEGIVLHSKGVSLAGAGQLEKAAGYFRAATVANPSFARAQFNLGLALKRLGQHFEAEAALRLAARLAPDAIEPVIELAELLADRGNLEEALGLLDELRPGVAPSDRVHAMRGYVLRRLGKLDEAADALREAVRLAPRSIGHRANLALVLFDIGRNEEADAQVAPVLESKPPPPAGVRLRLSSMLPGIPQSVGEIAERSARLDATLDALLISNEQIADPLTVLNSIPFYLAYAGLDDRPMLEKLAVVHRRLCPSLTFVSDHCKLNRAPDAAKGSRIRIGIASTNLHAHTIGRLNLGLIERLDRDRYELFVFDLSPDDAMSRRINSAAEHVVPCPRSLRELQRTIADCRLDVLFYPDIGMTPLTYYLAFARLAPVQCSTWGHPVTSGLDTIDCFISARDLETDGSHVQYTERLHALSVPGTCFARPQLPVLDAKVALTGDARTRFGFERNWNVYVCAQSLFKIHSDFDLALAGILRDDPRAHIMLVSGPYGDAAPALLDRFRLVMPETDIQRFTILPKLSSQDFLALLAAADVNLDTFHFGGGHTSLEALAMGSPIVTLPGRFLRGRITFALYRQMGLSDCIASDAADYVRLAVRLADDRAWRGEVVDAIRAKSDALFDNRLVVNEFEQFFEQAVRSSAAGS